jgi:hypothetical protein
MNQFFEDMQAFRKALRNKLNTGHSCWSCSSAGDGPLVWLNVQKDFKSLGLSTRGCQDSVLLCFPCAVTYMNSFNASLDRKQARDAMTANNR